MLTQPTLSKMHAMKLSAMAEALEHQLGSAEHTQLAFEDRLGLLVNAEWMHREERKLTRRRQRARLRHAASIEDVDFRAPRGLDRQVVLSLAQCRWIRDGLNLLITGPDRDGEVLPRLRFRRAGVPVGLLGVLRADRALGPRARRRSRRRLVQPRAVASGENRPAGPRRLAADALQGLRAPRLARSRRRPPRACLDPDHEPAPRQGLARCARRTDDRRLDLRSSDPRRAPNRAQGRLDARGANKVAARQQGQAMITVASLRPSPARIQGVLRVARGCNRRSWGNVDGRSLAWRPVDPAGAVENAHAFPTSSLDVAQTRRPQAPQAQQHRPHPTRKRIQSRSSAIKEA